MPLEWPWGRRIWISINTLFQACFISLDLDLYIMVQTLLGYDGLIFCCKREVDFPFQTFQPCLHQLFPYSRVGQLVLATRPAGGCGSGRPVCMPKWMRTDVHRMNCRHRQTFRWLQAKFTPPIPITQSRWDCCTKLNFYVFACSPLLWLSSCMHVATLFLATQQSRGLSV